MVEICCGSIQDALIAFENKADRIELNCALEVGGLTPSCASLVFLKQRMNIPIITMVRPRGAGFVYDEVAKQQMFLEAKDLLEAGSDGIAFGFLNQDYSIDKDSTHAMVALIKSYGKQAVFHRAFDQVADVFSATNTLIKCGVDRVLTSGQKPQAMQATDLLAQLKATTQDRLQWVIGGGVDHTNCHYLMQHTNMTQIHSSCKSYQQDVTTQGNVDYALLKAPQHLAYQTVDALKVKLLVESVQAFRNV